MLKRLISASLLSIFLSVVLSSVNARADKFAYVVNSLGQTLSQINLTTNEVTNDIEALGEAPNQIVIHGHYAYVINSLDHDIQIIDLATDNTVGYINIGEPRNPFHMTFVDSQYAYVTNLMTNTISKVDVIHRTVVGEYGVGQAPEGLLVVGNKLFVCCSGFVYSAYKSKTGKDWVFDPTHKKNDIKAYGYLPGRVYIVNIQSGTVVDSIRVGINPQYLDLDPEGKLNVVCTGNYSSVFGKIYRINPATNQVIDSIATGGSPGMISVGRDGIGYLAAGGWYPDSGQVYTFDSYADTMIRGSTNPIHTDCGVIAVSALYASQVLTCNFDADDINRLNRDGTLTNKYLVGDGPICAAVYTPSSDIPLLDWENRIILIVFLIMVGSFLIYRIG